MLFLLILVFLCVLMIFIGLHPLGSLLFALVITGPVCAFVSYLQYMHS